MVRRFLVVSIYLLRNETALTTRRFLFVFNSRNSNSLCSFWTAVGEVSTLLLSDIYSAIAVPTNLHCRRKNHLHMPLPTLFCSASRIGYLCSGSVRLHVGSACSCTPVSVSLPGWPIQRGVVDWHGGIG